MSSFYQVYMSYSIMKHSFPSALICSQSYYNWYQVCIFFMYIINIFGMITVDFFPIIDIGVKHASTIMCCNGILSLAHITQFSIFFQYLSVNVFQYPPRKKIPTLPAKSNNHFYFVVFFSLSPSEILKYGHGNYWYFSNCGS